MTPGVGARSGALPLWRDSRGDGSDNGPVGPSSCGQRDGCAMCTSLVHTVQCMEAEPRQCTRVGQGDDSSMASTPASCLVLWQRHPGHATHSPVPSRPKSLTPALTSYD
ncbi:hypothetical protein M758_7G075500 [Ceratodon purpureus]|nr:hypothetical protein M758_7G075500 [Ceratodon purpureus]